MTATITIDIDPMLHLGPLDLSWHGLMIAVGILVGGWLALRYAREVGLDPEPLLGLVLVLVAAGIVGARLLFLAQEDSQALLRPGDWLGERGYAFYGGMIAGALAAAAYLWRRRLSLRYLDALAAGFPLGMAVGRIGDLINGEHYGPATTLPWGIRYPNPGSEVPDHGLAYHSGGLYEIALALAILAVVWPLRHRFRRPTSLLWTVVALYGAGRFAMFFWRDDTTSTALGINVAQVESVALALVAAGGGLLLGRRNRAAEAAARS